MPGTKHQKSLAAFGLASIDLQVLQAHAKVVSQRMPGLLAELQQTFANWPEIDQALRQPEVHDARLAHWTRVATGDLSAAFDVSVERLATAFSRHKVPAYAVVICHSTVSNALIRELGLDEGVAKRFGTPQHMQRLADAQRLANIIRQLAWFDLELLLETYARIEDEARGVRLSQLEQFQQQAQSIVTGVAGGAEAVSSRAALTVGATEETATLAENVTEASRTASQNVDGVAAAAEELSASLSEVSQQVARAADIAQTANQAAQQTDATVQSLSGAASRISDVVALISSIAGQTNLLALNATIEAARAGEAGRGFAVVASEVKELAGQTAEATEEIAAQVSAMQSATRMAVDAIGRITSMIGEMDGVASTMAAAVEQQRAATQEIAGNVSRAATGTQAVVGSITGVSQAASTAGTAAYELRGVANELTEQAARLDVAMSQLLEQSKAA